jgi:hypothetical protein
MKHIKYIKQKDNTSCGPVAIINILKWLGCNVGYDYIDMARALCKWRGGTDGGTGDIKNALRALKIKAIHRKHFTLKKLDKHINNNGIAILEYIIPGYSIYKGWHYSLCVDKYKDTYVIVNDGREKTISYYRKSTVSKMMRRSKKYCSYWLVYK